MLFQESLHKLPLGQLKLHDDQRQIPRTWYKVLLDIFQLFHNLHNNLNSLNFRISRHFLMIIVIY